MTTLWFFFEDGNYNIRQLFVFNDLKPLNFTLIKIQFKLMSLNSIKKLCEPLFLIFNSWTARHKLLIFCTALNWISWFKNYGCTLMNSMLLLHFDWVQIDFIITNKNLEISDFFLTTPMLTSCVMFLNVTLVGTYVHV